MVEARRVEVVSIKEAEQNVTVCNIKISYALILQRMQFSPKLKYFRKYFNIACLECLLQILFLSLDFQEQYLKTLSDQINITFLLGPLV